jgi:hypothetical protein
MLSKETLVKVIAWHKVTDQKIEKTMSFGEWLKLNKKPEWTYKCLQI